MANWLYYSVKPSTASALCSAKQKRELLCPYVCVFRAGVVQCSMAQGVHEASYDIILVDERIDKLMW